MRVYRTMEKAQQTSAEDPEEGKKCICPPSKAELEEAGLLSIKEYITQR
jgi:hypothetical protein